MRTAEGWVAVGDGVRVIGEGLKSCVTIPEGVSVAEGTGSVCVAGTRVFVGESSTAELDVGLIWWSGRGLEQPMSATEESKQRKITAHSIPIFFPDKAISYLFLP